MTKNYPEMATDLSASIGRLRKGIPETMKGFSMMAAAATADAPFLPFTMSPSGRAGAGCVVAP